MHQYLRYQKRNEGDVPLLGKDLKSQVKQFILKLRDHGSPVSTEVVVAATKGIAQAKDATLLMENGGAIDITEDWGNRLLGRMGSVKQKCTTAAKKASPEKFEEVKITVSYVILVNHEVICANITKKLNFRNAEI